MELITRNITVNGKPETIYFRELTGGDQLVLMKGQKYRGGGNKGVEIDLGDQLERTYRMILLTLVNEDGKPVYPTLDDLKKETAKRLKALVREARKVHEEDDEGETEGNA